MSGEHPVAAVINTSPDVIELLRRVLEWAGFVVVSTLTYQIRDGVVDFGSFLQQHNPDVVVYDIAPPYEANWNLFLHLSQTAAMRGRNVVLTSTNANQVEGLRRPGEKILEIVGKPFDLDEIVRAVKEAARTRPI